MEWYNLWCSHSIFSKSTVIQHTLSESERELRKSDKYFDKFLKFSPIVFFSDLTSQNGQTHFKNLAAFDAIFLKCIHGTIIRTGITC